MATAVATKAKRTIHQLMRQFFAEAKGDESKARQRWLGVVQQDPALVTQALAYVADMLISGEVSGKRGKLVRVVTANADRAMSDRGLELRGISNLMSWLLPQSHKPLGKATKAEVHGAYFFHRKLRETHGVRERWFGLIWQALKDELAPVDKQLGEEDLKNLYVRAQKEEEAR